MEKSLIVSNNQMIADFMGVKFRIPKDKIITEYLINGGCYTSTQLKYERCWDWLMEVVEKIESEGKGCFVIKKKRCTIEKEKYYEKYERDSKIEAVYVAVVEHLMTRRANEYSRTR